MLQRVWKDAKLQSVMVPMQVLDGEERLSRLHTETIIRYRASPIITDHLQYQHKILRLQWQGIRHHEKNSKS